MSNLDLVRRLYESTRGGDFEAFAGLCAPELEWIQNEGFPYGGHHHGAAAVVDKVFRTLAQHWEGFGFAIEETLDAGDHVVVLGHYAGRHRQSGKSFRAACAHVISIEKGLVRRFRQYTDTAVIRDALA